MPPKGRGKDKKSKAAAAKKAAPAKKKDDVKEDHRSATGVLMSQPFCRDVKIGNFSLSCYSTELIQDGTIELTVGRKYGLLGANGSGKSAFLKCLAAREVPIPDHMDIFLLEQEAEPTDMTAVEAAIAYMKGTVDALEEEAEKAMEEFGAESEVVHDIYGRLDDMDPTTFEPRACELLKGLGFGGEMQYKKTRDMSGGWRMRVALAQALLVKPTLLLLDEPTNHLDLESVLWLEYYLREKYDRCLVMVSHSQDFLNNVCTNIIHLTPQHKLMYYSGNYDAFVKTKDEVDTNQMKLYKKEQDDIKHIKAFIASCGTYSNLVRQAKSKQKIIDKMEEKGLTEMPMPEPVFNFRWPEVEHLPPPVLALYDVTFSYSGKNEDLLYKNLNIGVQMDTRAALVGPNGAGKSTLLKLMAGDLTPNSGQVRRHLNCVLGRYHQHSVEQLQGDVNPLEFMRDNFPEAKKEEQDWRSFLGRYGIAGKDQTKLIGQMSDGQKSRLVFAIMAFKNPHILLLDEPTNHLDMPSIDALADAINHYAGGLVLVSHDFRLINQVAKEIWVCGDATISHWQGDIRSYKQHLAKNMIK